MAYRSRRKRGRISRGRSLRRSSMGSIARYGFKSKPRRKRSYTGGRGGVRL